MSGPVAQNSSLHDSDLLSRLRAGERPRVHHDTPAARQDYDTWRAAAVEALLADLRPGDHALAVWLLKQEMRNVSAEAADAGTVDLETLYRLVAAVARFGRPEDALLLWRAANTTPEARVGVDVEQALRPSPEAVLRALERQAADDPQAQHAADALAWVREGIASGAASDLPAYFAWADERFGLHISGPT